MIHTLLLALIIALSSPEASPANGEIRGIVQDSAHHLIAGAMVRARSTTEKIDHTTLSAADGSFLIGTLSPGNYRVFAKKDKFPKSPVATFELAAAQSFEVDLTLGAPSLHSSLFKRLAHIYVADWKGAAQ